MSEHYVDFVGAHARQQEEVAQLIEAGFDYVTQKDGLVYFRKRK